MKKINKKGFFLSETMVVIAIVAVVLLGVFKLFNSVYFSFIESENYNTVNAINALSNIQKYYESKGDIDTSIITEDVAFVDLTSYEEYNSDYYDRLKSEFKIEGIYLMDLNKLYSNDINDFPIIFRKYLNTLKNIQGIVLVVSLSDNEFAYTEIENYQTVTLIGDEDDEYAVYVLIGEEFVDPGYKNWEGEEPIITWENDIEVDTSKEGTYYKYYDFNGYLLRRKIVVGNHTLVKYVDNLEALEESTEEIYNNFLFNPKVVYEEKKYDTGIRYTGANPDNYVYFNCEEKDTNSLGYGETNYNYSGSCEKWRMVGVFEVEDGNGKIEKRIKIINTNSTFQASWDSSESTINSGYGVNQWGPSTYKDANDVSQPYAGADLMQLLNGYYIEKNDVDIPATSKKACKYNTAYRQSGFSKTCDTIYSPLSNVKMKPLTSTALGMIGDAVWYTYATDTSIASTAYLQERGITNKYTGCSNTETTECTTDKVTRNNKWTGLVGLMSVSDIIYADGWLYNHSIYPWAISPYSLAFNVWGSDSSLASNGYASNSHGVWPTAYLLSEVEIVSGLGTSTYPYIIK